jgi:hypothetical protein
MRKILFLAIFSIYLSNFCSAQLYFQPCFGENFVKMKIIKPSTYLTTKLENNHFVGVALGYRKNKFNHSIGLIKYEIGVFYTLFDKSKGFGVGWGDKYVENRNLFYGIDYDLFNVKRLSIKVGSKLHLSKSNLTWGTSGKTISPINEDTGAGIYVKGTTVVQAYKGTQIMIEPSIDIDLRLFKKITWNLHFGYILGNRIIYSSINNYSFNGIQQNEGEVQTDGSGYLLSTGFKFYLKNQDKK